jgi:long-chain acyl-CoA synthetase
MPRPHLLGLLEDAARRGEQEALSRHAGLRLERWSWRRLQRAAHGVARGLGERGVATGDRVLLRTPAGPEWVAGFWGGLIRGAVMVPLDLDGPEGFVDRVTRQTAPRLRLAETLLGEMVASAPEDGPPPAADVRRDTLAEIVFTSGTTADPKGVCLTHGNLLASIEPFEEAIARRRRLARAAGPLHFLCPLPLTHVYGQISAVFIPPLLGASVHFPRSLKAREIVEAVRRHRVNVMPCVPRQLELLREHVEREARRQGRLQALERALARADGWSWPRRWWAFRHVRRAFGWRFWVFATGGAALSRETEVFWRRLGYVVLQGYGLTETAALATLDDPFDSRRGSIGRPLPGREIRVDEHGQVLVRGEAVSPGYWEGGVRPLAGTDGWLPTGDLVERDPTGALLFRGREKEVIVTASGQNVFPGDLEGALDAQPEVRASAVVAHDGPAGPEAVAVLLLRDVAEQSVPDLLARANATLASHQRLRRALVWPGADLPRTAGTLKVKKREVAAWVARQLAPDASEGPADGTGNPLAPLIRAAGGEAPETLDPGASLATDLNLDSLGQLELLSALEERYQVEIDESLLSPETTVGDLESRLTADVLPAGAPYPFPTWAQRPGARVIRSVLQALVVLPIARVLCPLEVRGREHLRAFDGPALFVCNHVSMVDGGLVVAALPWRLRHRLSIAMSGEILRDWRHPGPRASWHQRLWGPLLYAATALLFGVYPLPQKSGFRRSFVFAGELVDRGQSLLVFPEGLRTRDGRLGPFLPGIGLMAAGLRVPVVPLRIDGLYALKEQRRHRARRGDVAITFGPPIRYDAATDAAAITGDLEQRVRSLR